MFSGVKTSILLAVALFIVVLMVAPSMWAQPITLTPDASWRLGVPARSVIELAVGNERLFYRVSTPERMVLEAHDLSGRPLEETTLPGKRNEYLPLFKIGPRGPIMVRFDRERGLMSGDTALDPPSGGDRGHHLILVGDRIGYYPDVVSCFRAGQEIPPIPETVELHVDDATIPVRSRLHKFAYLPTDQIVAAHADPDTARIEIHVIHTKSSKTKVIPVSEEWLNEALRRNLAAADEVPSHLDESIVADYRQYQRLQTLGVWHLTTHGGKVYFTPGREPRGQAHVYELNPNSGSLTTYLLELPEPGGWHPQGFGVAAQYFFVLGAQGRMLRFKK